MDFLEKHGCEKMQETNDVKASGFNGQSVEVIYKTPDGWVATQTHYEYGTYIEFCPFCGLELD